MKRNGLFSCVNDLKLSHPPVIVIKDDLKIPIKNRKINTFTNIILLLTVFFAFILILEAILRTTHLFNASISWSEPDPVLKWRYTPHSYYWFNRGNENDHPTTGYINNYGWRDKDWSLIKPPDTYRIAVLGDSYVEAFQVEYDRTFLAITENALNNNNNKVELMNFGRSGFTQTEELTVLKNEVMQFSPDMVVLYFLPNNDIDTIRYETCRESRPYYKIGDDGKLKLDTSFAGTLDFKIKSLINPIKQHSAIVSLLTERFNALMKLKSERPAKLQQNEIKGFQSLATDKPEPEFLKSYNLNKLLIKEISILCKVRGIRFMLVTIDNDEFYSKEIEEKYKSVDSSLNVNYFDDDMEEYARLLSIEFLGLNRIFRQDYEKNGLPLHWGHWNYRGHELVAKAFTNRLQEIILSDKSKNIKWTYNNPEPRKNDRRQREGI